MIKHSASLFFLMFRLSHMQHMWGNMQACSSAKYACCTAAAGGRKHACVQETGPASAPCRRSTGRPRRPASRARPAQTAAGQRTPPAPRPPACAQRRPDATRVPNVHAPHFPYIAGQSHGAWAAPDEEPVECWNIFGVETIDDDARVRARHRVARQHGRLRMALLQVLVAYQGLPGRQHSHGLTRYSRRVGSA